MRNVCWTTFIDSINACLTAFYVGCKARIVFLVGNMQFLCLPL